MFEVKVDSANNVMPAAPSPKLMIVSPIEFFISESQRRGKKNKKIICTFRYTLNMNNYKWCSFGMQPDFLDKDSDPFRIRTVKAQATVSDVDEYSEYTGKSIARARAEAKAYKALHRAVDRMVNIKLKELMYGCDAFCQKSLAVQEHNAEYVKRIGGID